MVDKVQQLRSSAGAMPASTMRMFAIVLALAFAAASVIGCKKSHRRDGEDLSEKPPIEARSEGAQQKFDEAKKLLSEGEYERAAQKFRLLQADHGDDPIADVAELYAARAALGDLSPGRFSGQEDGTGDVAEAKRQLESLAQSERVDDRVAYSAHAYLAAAHALEGERKAVFASLERYPGASVSSVVLAEDRPLLFLLIGESFQRAERFESAVHAYASLYAIYAEHRPERDALETTPDEELTEQQPTKGPESRFDDEDVAQLEKWVDLGRSRAFRLSDRKLADAQLQQFLATESPFLRAVGGWGLLRDLLDEGVDSEEGRAAVEDLFNRVSPAMVEIGAGDRAAELSTSLAAAGGPRRLAVGVVLPLTGKASGVGAKVMAGALTAMRAFDATDEPSVTLVFQDSSQPAEEVFKRFSKQGVSAVVGPLDRDRAVEYAAAAEAFEIPLMTMTAQSARELMKQAQGADSESADEGVSEESGEKTRDSYVFRNFVDPRAEARAAARLAFEEAGDRKAAIVYPGIGYGRTMAEVFRGEFRLMGGQIVAEIEYDRNSSDFASVAEQLASSDAEAVFVPESASKVAELTAFFANANIWGYPIDEEPPSRSNRRHVHYFGTSLWQDPMLIRQARSYVDGAAVPSWFSPSFSSDRVSRFVRRFDAVYGRNPDNFEAFAYDSVSWFVTLLVERGMTRPEALRDALATTPSFEGVTGTAKFRPDGEAVRKLRFVTPSDEGFAPLPFTARTESASRQQEEPQGGEVQPEDTTEPPGAAPQ